MILTRHLINPNIKFTDVDFTGNMQEYDYQTLCTRIDGYKNLLQQKYHCFPGQHAVIGVLASIDQTALVFACAELAISLTIIDYAEIEDWAESGEIDSKTKLLLPIDYYFLDLREWTTLPPKLVALTNICKHNVLVNDLVLDNTANDVVLTNSNSDIMRCVSNGPAPKVVTHTHEFISALASRNGKMYSGTAGVIKNLQHGSSYATYFLPILLSKDITNIVNFKMSAQTGYKFGSISKFKLTHLMLPYRFLIDDFFNETDHNQTLIIFTLSSITPSYAELINQGKAKNIVSSFGSAETGGPVFINQLMPVKNFDPLKFVKVDDFYQIELDDEKRLNVTLPGYENYTVNTGDKFNQVEDYYYFQPRTDFVRINGREVDLIKYQHFLDTTLPAADLIYDTVENRIYLALWKDADKKNIDDFIRLVELCKHRIMNVVKLNKEEFTQDGKIDQNLLLNYFRNYNV
jgi:acyl-CoA synthetase (AMP-forming)/AMP-acid ligase II